MRPIKFRALMSGTDNWIIGYPREVYENGIDSIENNDGCEYIRTDTLGQFTGLTDKNSREIYEGDVLRYTKHSGYIMENCLMLVCFDTDTATFGYKSSISMFSDYIFSFSNHDELKEDVLNHCEIIGNIFNNPELNIHYENS